MSKATTCGILLLGLLTSIQSAKAALLPAKADTVKSIVLHQVRSIDVYLPEESTKDSKQRFQTL